MLTDAQNAIVKAYILSVPELANQPFDGDGLGFIRDHLNAPASPPVMVWNSATSVDDLMDTIDRSKFTPSDAITDTVLFTNRILAAQTKLMSLDGLVQNRVVLNAEKATIRNSLRDALIALPTGTGGAIGGAAGANGINALTACTKNTSVVQRLLLAQTAVTTGPVTAGILGYAGPITNEEVDTARRS